MKAMETIIATNERNEVSKAVLNYNPRGKRERGRPRDGG